MNWSIIGYWTTKHTKLVFPVVQADEIKTADDYNSKIPQYNSNVGTNNSTLEDIKGTIYGDLIAFALSIPTPSSDVAIVPYATVSYDTKTTTLVGAKYKRTFNVYGGTSTNIQSTTFHNICYGDIQNDTYDTPEYYDSLGIIYLPDEKKFALFTLNYTIGGSNSVTASRDYRTDRDYWLTELKLGVQSIPSENGDFSLGPLKPPNPYEPGGDSGEGGGGGTFDGDSDQIPDSSLPTLSAADTGFTRLYTPTLSQVQDLARYLWTDESIIETLWNVVKRYFEDPMQAFISFSIVPVPVPVAGVEDFKVLFIPTGVMLNTVANQFVDVDCGTFEMKEYYGSALDYSPNTKVSCYLPYIGTVSLNTDDVMGRTLQVKYRVDICSGSCVAKILVDGNVIYQFPGCCCVPIPFTSADFSSYGAAIISAVKTGVALAAAGAGATELGANIIGMNASQQTGESYTKTTVDTVRNPATGRQITAGTQKITKEVTGTKASFSGIAQTGLANTANSVTASKTIVERSGSFSGNSGYLGVRRPYLIIERPRMCMPANYQQLNGFPSMMTMVLSECKGYTRVQQIQLTGVEATNPEQAEILELLKGGVIL